MSTDTPAAATAPVLFHDTRPARSRTAIAIALLSAVLILMGCVQSLRERAIDRLKQVDSAQTSASGLGASLTGSSTPKPAGSPPWTLFFGISGALVLIGCGLAYSSATPLQDRRRVLAAAKSDGDTHVSAGRSRVAELDAQSVRRHATIAETIANATRDQWTARGYAEADVLRRLAAHPEIFGAYSAPKTPLLGRAQTPIGDALFKAVKARDDAFQTSKSVEDEEPAADAFGDLHDAVRGAQNGHSTYQARR